jgi:hypothetical protein
MLGNYLTLITDYNNIVLLDHYNERKKNKKVELPWNLVQNLH